MKISLLRNTLIPLLISVCTINAQTYAPIPLHAERLVESFRGTSDSLKIHLDRVEVLQGGSWEEYGLGEMGLPKGFLPVLSEEEAESFWISAGPKTLTMASVIGNENQFASNIEMLSDLLWILRLSLGFAVASVSSENEDPVLESASNTKFASIERLLRDGGAVHFSTIFPLFYAGGADNRWAAAVLVKGNLGWDSPRAGELLNKPSISKSIAAEVMGFAIGRKREIGLEASIQFEAYSINKNFRRQLFTNKNSAYIIEFGAGIILFRQTRLGLSLPLKTNHFLESVTEGKIYIQQFLEFSEK